MLSDAHKTHSQTKAGRATAAGFPVAFSHWAARRVTSRAAAAIISAGRLTNSSAGNLRPSNRASSSTGSRPPASDSSASVPP